jgi:hypothetical protein
MTHRFFQDEATLCGGFFHLTATRKGATKE